MLSEELRENFALAARHGLDFDRLRVPPRPRCRLVDYDPRARSCRGRLEAMHVLPRQRVRNRLRELLDGLDDELVVLAEWDPRNALLGCEAHHRRFDGHATPDLVVPGSFLPAHIHDFAADWSLESELERRFPG